MGKPGHAVGRSRQCRCDRQDHQSLVRFRIIFASKSELERLPADADKSASPVIAHTSTSAPRNTTPTVATANSHRVVTPAIVLASVAAPVDAAPSAELGQTGAPTPQQTAPAQGRVHIEQVELTPQQLAFTAQERAQKSLDSNNLSDAIDQYQEALRYTPNDEKIRQTLSALYYGKGEVRKSADLLQQGIERNANGQELRLALAKLLIKENQPQAALTPLLYLPSGASEAYLSLRAALAQKVNQDDIAKQSYQQLVQIAPNNGRWWMGLGIQQERALQTKQAASSYQMALDKIGLSSQSQQFIRQRLAVLKQLEEQPSAN